MSINFFNIVLFMLFHLLLPNITILLCFFFFFAFRVVFNTFFTILVVIENAKLNLAFAIPKGAPITVANDGMKMSPLVVNKTIKGL